MNPHDLKFRRSDCVVMTAEVDYGAEGSRPRTRYGMTNGSSSINGRIASREELNRVTIIHGGTGLSVSEYRYAPHRNKELAFQQLEKLVNARLEELRAGYDRAMAAAEAPQEEL